MRDIIIDKMKDATEIIFCEEGDIWISRSQARKILAGLERYKKIVFNFAGIDMVGQGFADEIFRVFNIAHPEIELEAINMSDGVRLMVEHARNDETGRGGEDA